jgi:hypothetical protein
MQKGNTALIVILVLIVLGILAYAVWGRSDTSAYPNTTATTSSTTAGTTATDSTTTDTGTTTGGSTGGTGSTQSISGDTANLVRISIQPGDAVTNGQTITGAVKGSYFFEANAVGKLLNANKNTLKQFPITATGNWQTADAVNFSFVLDTNGLPKGTGFIRIQNDNPSGDPARDKYIDIPVVFQ